MTVSKYIAEKLSIKIEVIHKDRLTVKRLNKQRFLEECLGYYLARPNE